MEALTGFATSLAALIAAIGILVTVHEFGHFWVARRLGVKVLRFSVGFGRPIWSRRAADGTEYAIGVLPLGGYVKMLDEEAEDVPQEELEYAFNRKPLRVRAAIVLAGPAFNFLFAALVWWLVFMIGVADLRAVVGEVAPGSLAERAGLGAGDAVVEVEGQPARSWAAVVEASLREVLGRDTVELRWTRPEGGAGAGALDLRGVALDDLAGRRFFDTVGIEPATPAVPPRIGETVPGGPAALAGLRAGDVVVGAGGEPVRSWAEWVRFVRARPGVEFPVEVLRGGAALTLALRPDAVSGGGETFGRIGVALDERAREGAEDWYVVERLGPWSAAARAAGRTWEVTALTVALLWKMVRLEMSSEHLSGPITIARYARDSASGGFARFIEFLAIVSVSLGILNLLPIPILDGGHLLLQIAEFLKGGPLSPRAVLRGQQVGILMLVGLMGLALYNDLMRVFVW